MILKDLLCMTIKEWNSISDNLHDYLSIKMKVENGCEVVIKDNNGTIHGYLKMDEVNKVKFLYLSKGVS